MEEPFELKHPEEIQTYLDSFHRDTRQAAERCVNEGRIEELHCVESGRDYRAIVQENFAYQIRLAWNDAQSGWDSQCTCAVGRHCRHACALAVALIAEHRLAVVRNLSRGKPEALDLARRFERKPTTEGDLPSMVNASLKRALRPSESRYLNRIRRAYAKCRASGKIQIQDFHQLELYLPGLEWEPLEIWPSFPPNEYEFWLYVAHWARQHDLQWPDFLDPVTNLEKIEPRIREWQRNTEVKRWQEILASAEASTAPPPREITSGYEFRLRFLQDAAVLEWKSPGQTDFEPMRVRESHQFKQDWSNGLIALSSEAELLWEILTDFMLTMGSLSLSYNNDTHTGFINRVLRIPALHQLLVTGEGMPYRFAAESLRWTAEAPEDVNGDYRFRLVRENGEDAPPVWFAAPGPPPCYLTKDTIYLAASYPDAVLDPYRENRIPAAAIESAAGVHLLHRLDISLPQRLQDRMREVPMRVVVECHLAESQNRFRPQEKCVIQIMAGAEDESRSEEWKPNGWTEITHPKKPVGNANTTESRLTIYDRSDLRWVPQILDPLPVKWDGSLQAYTLKVRRTFPDLFSTWLKSVPGRIQVVLDDELKSLADDKIVARVRLDAVENEIDWFDLRVIVDVQDTNLTREELKALLNAKGKHVRLHGKGWRRLEFNVTEEEDEQLARLGLNPHALSNEPQRLHALQLTDEAAKRFLPEHQVEDIHRRAGEIKARVTPEIPASVTAQLRPYQLDGFHFLAYLATNNFGGILADDMGLGKTLQTLVWLVWLIQQASDTPSPSLVVCPKSVMDNWHAEAERFTPHLRVRVWSAGEVDQMPSHTEDADLHVINYSQLRMIGDALASISWLSAILDEGQYIKNPSSQTAQAARAMQARYRLVLTGTPIENRLLDLWSLMAFAMPGVLGNRHNFGKLYDAKSDLLARRRLSSRVRPFLLRRTKSQVAEDLPDRIEEDLFCEFEPQQQVLYRAELKRAQQLLLRIKTQKQLAKEQFQFLVALLRLRQICCHPALVQPDFKGQSAKFNALMEQLEPLMEEGQKVLIFSQWVALLKRLAAELKSRRWPTFYLDGETENRGELVRNFQTAKGRSLFLISLRAGGFGLNLTSASYVVLFDPWWNPAVENQAIDRTHRIGQTRKVIAYRLLIKGSIEEKIRLLQKKKSALAEDVLGEEKFSQSLTLDDLRFLFAD